MQRTILEDRWICYVRRCGKRNRTDFYWVMVLLSIQCESSSSLKCPNTTYTANIFRPKCFSSFLWIKYVLRIREHSDTKHYTWRIVIVQNLYEFSQFFLSDFLSSKCFNTLNIQNILGGKCFNANKLYTTENVVYNFINEMIILLIKIITVAKLWRKHFNKDLLVTKKDSEDFKNSTKCWICNNTYVDGDVKVRGHCRITGNYRGSDSCNINVKLNRFRT